MTDTYPLLFSPFDLRERRIRNRIVSTPHATGWAQDGLIARSEVDYHVRKAAGGCGLVMTFGSAVVDSATGASYGSISLWDKRNEPALQALAQGVHDRGALCISQMTHMGRRGNSKVSGVALRAPSDIPEGVHREVPVPLEHYEIDAIVESFAECAKRLESCGWDGCEVTSFGGHLIEQFFDPMVNRRTDRYGGTFENRTRFAREVLEAVRSAVSDRFIISFRMTVDQCLDDGLEPSALRQIARQICASGAVDLLSVSGGTGATPLSSGFFVPPDAIPEAAYSDLAGEMRRAVEAPVLLAGRILDGRSAERCLSDKCADLVAMTRAIIADPDLPRSLATGQRYRPCITINEGCIGRLYSGYPMACSVNPGIRSPELESPPSDPNWRDKDRVVVVVGGGVAGLEAARMAGRRGWHVVVFERADQLGGRARLAAVRRQRGRWRLYLEWLEAEVRDVKVEVRLGVEATADDVSQESPSAIIVATGSRLRRDAVVPGPVTVMDADEILAGGGPGPGDDTPCALVVDHDGGFSAPSAAEKLVSFGWQVEIVSPQTSVCVDVDPTQLPFVLRDLEDAGVLLTPNRECVATARSGARLRHVYSGREITREGVGLIAVAGARQAEREIVADLQATSAQSEIHIVGDALAPRSLLDAVAEGARAGLAVLGDTEREGAPGAPLQRA